MKILIEEQVLWQALEALGASMSMMDEYSYRQTMCGEKGFDTLRAILALRAALDAAQHVNGNCGDRHGCAEAIVKECASIILNNDIEKQEHYDINSPFFAGWERGVIDSAQIIKQHFGIKDDR